MDSPATATGPLLPASLAVTCGSQPSQPWLSFAAVSRPCPGMGQNDRRRLSVARRLRLDKAHGTGAARVDRFSDLVQSPLKENVDNGETVTPAEVRGTARSEPTLTRAGHRQDERGLGGILAMPSPVSLFPSSLGRFVPARC
jgi:hypothetical protein